MSISRGTWPSRSRSSSPYDGHRDLERARGHLVVLAIEVRLIAEPGLEAVLTRLGLLGRLDRDANLERALPDRNRPAAILVAGRRRWREDRHLGDDAGRRLDRERRGRRPL